MAGLLPTTTGLGLVRVGANVEQTFGGKQVVDGVLQPQAKEQSILAHELQELATLSAALAPVRAGADA